MQLMASFFIFLKFFCNFITVRQIPNTQFVNKIRIRIAPKYFPYDQIFSFVTNNANLLFYIIRRNSPHESYNRGNNMLKQCNIGLTFHN